MSGYQFALKNGRKIGVSVLGEPTATKLVVLCLPTPGAGAFDPDPRVTSQHAVRVVCIDRPGYGGSEPLPEKERPSIELFADDIADYLSHTTDLARGTSGLDLGSAAIVGWSFGGLVALAAAGRHPELVDRLVVVGAPRPKRLRRGERYSPVAELRKRGVERSRRSLVETLDEDGRPSLSALGVDIDDADQYGLGTSGRIEHMLEAAWLHGGEGVASDRIAASDDGWTAVLEEIRCQTLLLYSDDPVAGPVDARWYSSRVGGLTVNETSSAGRLTLLSEWDRILHWAAPET